MTFSQALLAVLCGNAITAGVLYCVWLSKRDGDNPKGIAFAIFLGLLVAAIGYAARS